MKKDCYYCRYNQKGYCVQLGYKIYKPVKIVDCSHSQLNMDKIKALYDNNNKKQEG